MRSIYTNAAVLTPSIPQVSALVLVVLTFLFALRWFQRQRVTKPELVTVASTKETNLGDAEKVESAPLPPAALVGESGGSGAVAPVLAGVSEDAGDVEERLAGETQASAMVLPSPGVVTSSGGYEHGEAAPLEVSGEGGQAVPPTVTRALSVVTVAAMEEGEGESVPLPPSLVGESGGVGAVVPLVGTSIETWPPAEEWHALSMRRDALQTDSEGARSHEGVAQQSIMDATASVVAVARSESRSVRTENDGAALLEDGQVSAGSDLLYGRSTAWFGTVSVLVFPLLEESSGLENQQYALRFLFFCRYRPLPCELQQQ